MVTLMQRSRIVFAIALLTAIPVFAGCVQPPVGLYETEWTRNVIYADRDGGVSLSMDIVRPKGLTSPRPVVLWLHGGGWAFGNRRLMHPLAETTASLGYVSASASYRLANRNCHFPAQVEDAAAAVRFLRRYAADYRIDPDRIVIGGESAGGHLALMVGLCRETRIIGDEPHEDVSTSVCGVVNIYGPTMLAPLEEGGGLHVAPIVKNFMGCTEKEHPDRYRDASPITWVSAAAPPILTLHGEWDSIVPFSQATLLKDACHNCGARNDFGRVRYAEHGWIANPSGSVYRNTLPLLAQFLAQVTQPGAPAPETESSAQLENLEPR